MKFRTRAIHVGNACDPQTALSYHRFTLPVIYHGYP